MGKHRLTKVEMARAIVQALFGLPELPSPDTNQVLDLARAPAPRLRTLYLEAVDMLRAQRRRNHG